MQADASEAEESGREAAYRAAIVQLEPLLQHAHPFHMLALPAAALLVAAPEDDGRTKTTAVVVHVHLAMMRDHIELSHFVPASDVFAQLALTSWRPLVDQV
jgi:hypothetical protein